MTNLDYDEVLRLRAEIATLRDEVDELKGARYRADMAEHRAEDAEAEAARVRQLAVDLIRDMAALMLRCHGCSEDDDVIQAVFARTTSFVNGYGGSS